MATTGNVATAPAAGPPAAPATDAPPMRWTLMVLALAGEPQPPEPQAPGPARRFDRRPTDGPHEPEHCLRWRDTDRHASGQRRVLGFR